MKVIVAGGRDFKPTEKDYEWLSEKLTSLNTTEVVSGKARGADSFGEEVANKLNIPIKEFPASWDTFGRSAGVVRNVQMARYADVLIAFDGGRGTDHMVREARKNGLKVFLSKNREEL